MSEHQGASAEVECLPAAPDAFLAAAAASRLRAAVASSAGLGSNGAGPSSGGKRAAGWRNAAAGERLDAEAAGGGDAGPSFARGAAAEASWGRSQPLEPGSSAQDRGQKRQRIGAECPAAKALPAHCSRPGIPPEADLGQFRVLNRPSPPFRADDKDGHYRYEPGENLSTRYKILSKLGEGTFGRVLECWDRKHKDYVAIKIVRNVPKYRDAAMIELEVLNTLMWNDPTCAWHCVSLREWFNYRGHVCMVFEKLGPSLYDFLRKNRYRPFPLSYVRSFALQLIEVWPPPTHP